MLRIAAELLMISGLTDYMVSQCTHRLLLAGSVALRRKNQVEAVAYMRAKRR